MSDIKPDKFLIITATLADRSPFELFLYTSYDPLWQADRYGKVGPNGMIPTTDPEKFLEPVTYNPKETYIYDAVRSSAAAPTYFSPNGKFVDGGLVANNPTLECIAEISRYKHRYSMLKSTNDNDKIQDIESVISIGCGIQVPSVGPDMTDVSAGLLGIGNISRVLGFTKAMLETQFSTEGYKMFTLKTLCESMNVNLYRLNSPLSKNMVIDTTDKEIMFETMWDAEIWCESNRDAIKEICGLLEKGSEYLKYV